MKYKIGIGNAYGSVYTTRKDNKWWLGIDCQINAAEEIEISESVAEELINKVEGDNDFQLINKIFNMVDKMD